MLELFGASLEQRFDPGAAMRWMERYWGLSFATSAAYLALVFSGQRAMEKRERFDLSRCLLWWNVGLAAFSAMGCYSLLPELLRMVWRQGFLRSVCACKTRAFTDPEMCLWAWLFTLSKVAELGDTAFIVLRKSKLTFLHWYHHIATLMTAWWCFSTACALGHWSSSVNFTVHCLMYSYYAARAAGYRVPEGAAKAVTVLQIAQMFLGMGCTFGALFVTVTEEPGSCEVPLSVFCYTLVLYGSFCVLFLNFFYHRYIKTRTHAQ